MSETKTKKYKLISFGELHLLSTKNNEKFNRNVWTEKLIEEVPELKDWNMLVSVVLIHEHHLGKKVDPHYRCMIHTGIDELNLMKNTNHKMSPMFLQDMSFEQFESLRDLTPEQERVIKV